MSISSTQGPITFTITSLPYVATITFPFNVAADVGVADGAVILTLGSDYTITGGGYNGANQLQTGDISIVSGGAGNVQIGDVVTIYRNISPVQTTTFASTGLQTPLMIESGLDKLTTIAQEIEDTYYLPFPPAGAIFTTSSGTQTLSGTPNTIFLGWIQAQTGGTKVSVDSLNVVSIPTLQLPLVIAISIADDYELWKLRPMQTGDPSVSVG
jgi:hypothetical protein